MSETQLKNGVDVELLGKTAEAIQDNPSLAKFQFRTTTRWISGGHTQSHIQGFHGVGQENQSRKHPFVIESDEPAVLLGTNQGANAVELLLAGLASCLSVGLAYNAAAMGIALEELQVDVTGDIDLQGFLGLSESIRPGCGNINVACHLKSTSSDSDIASLLDRVRRTSPVTDMVSRETPIDIKVERL